MQRPALHRNDVRLPAAPAQRAGIVRLPSASRKEGGAVEDDAIGPDIGDGRLEALDVGVGVIDGFGHRSGDYHPPAVRDPLRLGRTVADERNQPIHIRAQGAGALADPVAESQVVAARIENEVSKLVVGQTELVRAVVIALCGGHCLVEGTPGLGKTLLVRTLGRALG